MGSGISCRVIASEFRCKKSGQTTREWRSQGGGQPSIESFDAMRNKCSDTNRSELELDRLVYNRYGLAEDEIGAVERAT